ncbi:MAG: hypothetical protein LBL71_01700 [Endomicrobium sp.]|jgi:hypothetical protein|nr:hypothetical protein [Endomicrobium sp.]
MKKIKIFFYTLFLLDILAGCIVAVDINMLCGIITSAVLLLLNITVYAIIIKVEEVDKLVKK